MVFEILVNIISCNNMAPVETKSLLWPLLLTWFNFNPSMDKLLHAQKSVGWNYLSIPKLQRLHCWNLGLDK